MFGVVVSSYFCISLRPVVIRLSQVFVSELFFEAELRIFFDELLHLLLFLMLRAFISCS